MDDEELTGQDYYLDGVQDTKEALVRQMNKIHRNHETKTFTTNQVIQLINGIDKGFYQRRLDS